MNFKRTLIAYLCLNIMLFTFTHNFISHGNISPISQEVSAKPPNEIHTSIKLLPEYEPVLDNPLRSLDASKTLTPDGLSNERIRRSYPVKDIVVTASAVNISRYVILPEGLDKSRLKVLNTGVALLDSIPYFWGGKPANPGWNALWGQDVVVTSSAVDTSSQTDTSATANTTEPEMAPYGLDCSGFVDWCYWTSLGYRVGYSTADQWHKSRPISEDELIPGDLAFLYTPSTPLINHVGIYIGTNSVGQKRFIHCASEQGVVISSPGFKYFRRPYIDIYE